MFNSSKPDLFYIPDRDVFDVMIRVSDYGDHANVLAHQVSGWMTDSLPHRERVIFTRVDHFFGDGRYMRWTVSSSELTMIKLAWKIKTRDQWVAEYQDRTRKLMEKIKEDMDRILNTSLTRNLENAFIESAFTTKAVNQLSTMIGKPTDE